MRRWPFLMLGASIALSGCGGDVYGDSMVRRIQRNEKALRPLLANSATVELGEEGATLVGLLLRDYAQYANAHHGDSLALLYLMRRADLLLGQGDHEAAIEQWVNIAEGGGQKETAAEAVFRVGFVRETAMKDTLGALKAYGEVVRVYPESRWASSAIEAAKWLSFSEAEMLKALDK